MLIHWIFIHTGTYNEAGPYYGFFSGFGSDLGEVALIGSAVALFRHRNCHVKGCWRMGKQVEGTPYLACHVHHPDHKGDKRNVPHSQIKDARR